MSISAAAWTKVNTALNPTVITNIAEHIDNEGLGHLVWGSKPVFHLEGLIEDGIWQDMKQLLRGERLKENFELIAAASNQQKPAEEHVGYLVNKRNLCAAIRQNKSFFAAKFGISELSRTKAIMDECVIPYLKQLDSEAFNSEQEFLAITLGFGRTNATAPMRPDEANHYTAHVKADFERWRNSRAQEKGASYPIPKLPPFLMLPTEESPRLVSQYARDSDEIHTDISNLLEQHGDLIDDNDLELSDAEVIVAALLTTLRSAGRGG